jgi:hypothetical protein
MDGTNFALVISFLRLVLISTSVQDVPTQADDEEAFNLLIDDAWNPVEILLSGMALSVIKLRRTSVTDSSSAVSSLDIHTRER